MQALRESSTDGELLLRAVRGNGTDLPYLPHADVGGGIPPHPYSELRGSSSGMDAQEVRDVVRAVPGQAGTSGSSLRNLRYRESRREARLVGCGSRPLQRRCSRNPVQSVQRRLGVISRLTVCIEEGHRVPEGLFVSSKFKTCRRCGERTFDFDAELQDWWCSECDSWADV